jgi:hypothetical protein
MKNDGFLQESYNFQNTIPKGCVHRAVVGEVFLTGIKKIDNDRYVTAGYLPKSHIYFNDIPYRKDKRSYDGILLLEICRQTSIYITHNFFSVPYSAKFIFDDAEFELISNKLSYNGEQSHVIVDVHISERKFRKSEINGLIFDMCVYIDGRIVANKKMNITWMDEKKWNKLRSFAISKKDEFAAIIEPAKANDVGRELQRNVVIGNLKSSDCKVISTLIADQTHPSIFDHPLDHIPGMLLIESYRQTALLALKHSLKIQTQDIFIKKYKVCFLNFCEFDMPAYCKADIHFFKSPSSSNDIKIPMNITQNDKIISEAILSIVLL